MPSKHSFAAAIAALAAAAAASPLPARADGFDARPITVETRDGLGAVVLTNSGDHRVYLETQVYDWVQDAAGHDVLAESDTAIASPPAMWVGPHSVYNLRVKLPLGAPGQERAFRIVVRQLPDRSEIVGGRVVFALTQSLPAFAEPAEMAPPALHGRFVDSRHIVIANDGGRRARLADVAQDGRTVAPGLVGYALAHSSAAISLPSPLHPGNIEVQTDLGPRTLDLR